MSQFDDTAQATFKSVVAAGVGNLCATSDSNPSGACTAVDVVILSVSAAARRTDGTEVEFDVRVARGNAKTTAKNLVAFIDDQLVPDLKAEGGELAAVESVQVVKAPKVLKKAKKRPDDDMENAASIDSAADSTVIFGVDLMVLVLAAGAAVLLLGCCLALCCVKLCCGSSKHETDGHHQGDVATLDKWRELTDDSSQDVAIELPPYPGVASAEDKATPAFNGQVPGDVATSKNHASKSGSGKQPQQQPRAGYSESRWSETGE